MNKETPKKGKTKQKILRAAIKCFGRKGIEQTKIIEIAKEAGITHSLVLYHYPTFEEICFNVVENLVEEYFKASKKINISLKDPKQQLTHYIQSQFILAQKSPSSFCVWLHFYYKAALDTKYRNLLGYVRINSLDKLKTLISIYLDKYSNKDVDNEKIEELARFILSLISGNLIMALTEKSLSFNEYSKLTVKMVKLQMKDFL